METPKKFVTFAYLFSIRIFSGSDIGNLKYKSDMNTDSKTTGAERERERERERWLT